MIRPEADPIRATNAATAAQLAAAPAPALAMQSRSLKNGP